MEIIQPPGDSIPIAAGTFDIDGQNIHVIGAHPPPPLGRRGPQLRAEEIQEVFQFVGGYQSHIILAGDFNTTTWSPVLGNPLKASGLQDSRIGFGQQPSISTVWPALLRIPIDQVFVYKDFHVANRSLGPHIGSDHLPILMDFQIISE